MADAPRHTPIIAVCGGLEMAVIWGQLDSTAAGPDEGRWYYFDEDDGGNTWEAVRGRITGWRPMDWGQ